MRDAENMKRARKLAIALLAAAVVVAAVYTTGAFTSTTASRSADVRVAGDGSAFLSLQPSEGPNGEYASYGPDGALEVRLDGAGSRASGVNPDSTTEFANVFTIINKGSQSVTVWLTGGSAAVTFVGPDGTSIEDTDGAVTLQPGGQPAHVGLTIDARGVKPGTDLLASVTIRTETGVGGGSAPAAAPDGDTSGGADTRTTTSETSDPALPIVGGVPGSPGDGRFYSVGSTEDNLAEADNPVDLGSAIARRLAPFGEIGGVLTDHEECAAGSTETESSESAPSVPEGPTTPSTETAESSTTSSEETSPRHATRPACEDRDSSFSVDIDRDDPLVQVATLAVVISPVDGLGPADEAAAGGWVAKRSAPYASKATKAVAKKAVPYATKGAAILGSVFAAGGVEKTKEREQESEANRNEQGQENQQNQQDEQEGDSGDSDSSKRCGFLGWRCLPPGDLRADGGASQTALEENISEANKWQGSKLDRPLTTDEVVRVGRDADGNLTYLTNTDKWNQSEKQIPGWRHIVERHVQSNSTHYSRFNYTDGYPTEPAQEADPDTTMFHRDMTPNEIQDLIMESARNGNAIQNNDPFTKEIVYSVPKTSVYYKKYSIKKRKVVIREKIGMIKTAYPIDGGVKHKNT